MNDLAQFQPAFNGVNTLLAVSTNIETEQITNGNLKLKGNSSFLNTATILSFNLEIKTTTTGLLRAPNSR
jgi:hypothetical protein